MAVALECLLEYKFSTVCALIPQLPIPIFVQCHSAHIPSWLVGIGEPPAISSLGNSPTHDIKDMLRFYQSAANSIIP